MNAELQDRLGAAREPFGLRLRELHCALALRDTLAKYEETPIVAAMWGTSHVDPDGFARFLPAAWRIVALRIAETPDDMLLVDPILAGDGALFLASPDAAKHFERKRTQDVASKPLPPGVKIDAERKLLVATIGKRTLVAAVDDVPAIVELADDPPEITVTLRAHMQ
jgi:hypothetical protein